VQIFTRRNTTPLLLEGSARAGSYAGREVDISLGAASRQLSVSLGAARRSTDGTLDFNNDYRNHVLSGRVAASPGRGFRASVSGRQHEDEFHYPTDGAGRVVDRNAFRKDRRSMLALEARQELGPRVDLGVSLGAMEGRPRTDDATDGRADTSGFYAYRSAGSVRRRVADARMNLRPASNNIATIGYEWQHETQRTRDSSNFDAAPNQFAAERTTRAAYGQWVGEVGPLSYALGGRYDDNDVFGTFRTARGGVAWRPRQGLTLRGSIGSAFKAPTFLEQFNTAFTIGDPALEPERSRSIEAGATQALANGRVELTATWFNQRFSQLIQYAFVDIETPNYFNVAAASAHGVEIESRAHVAGTTQLDVAVTLLRTRVDDTGFDRGQNATFVKGNRLLRRPSVTVAIAARTYLTNRLTADARALHVGSRDDRDFSDFPAKPLVLESYRRVDAGLAYRLTDAKPSLTFFLRAENVLDSEYEEVANFKAPGRTVWIGMRVVSGR